MRYFDHDVTASQDTKIIELRLSCGGAAVDAYWYLLERMYTDERPLSVCNGKAMHVHSHCLCTDDETLCSWIDSMVEIGLFIEGEGGEIFSNRAMMNIEDYHEKAEKRSSAAKKRWDSCKSNANAMQVHSKCNANAMQEDSRCNANKRKEKKRKDCNANQSIANPSSLVGGEEEAATIEESKTPYCASCGEVVIFKPDSMAFVCRNCGTLHAADEVVFR